MNRSDSRAKRRLILFGIFSLLLLAFIWGNSLQSRADSSGQSLSLAALLKPLLDPFDRMDQETFHNWLRKAAHFAEFAALGACVGGFAVNLGKLRSRRYVALPVLITLAAAVTDEYIQIFSGRGSQVSDIVLDFSGALTGLAFAALCCLIKRKLK